jgi:hypothetical protein
MAGSVYGMLVALRVPGDPLIPGFAGKHIVPPQATFLSWPVEQLLMLQLDDPMQCVRPLASEYDSSSIAQKLLQR